MSFFGDILGFFGGGSRASASVSSSNSTSVTVSPNIATIIDTAPLAEGAQKLVDAMTGSLAPAVASIGTAIKDAAKSEAKQAETLQEIATWASVAGVVFALVRLVRE
jgi:hypothetical protein